MMDDVMEQRSSLPPTAQKPCRRVLRRGRCKYGDKCFFAHGACTFVDLSQNNTDSSDSGEEPSLLRTIPPFPFPHLAGEEPCLSEETMNMTDEESSGKTAGEDLDVAAATDVMKEETSTWSGHDIFNEVEEGNLPEVVLRNWCCFEDMAEEACFGTNFYDDASFRLQLAGARHPEDLEKPLHAPVEETSSQPPCDWKTEALIDYVGKAGYSKQTSSQQRACDLIDGIRMDKVKNTEQLDKLLHEMMGYGFLSMNNAHHNGHTLSGYSAAPSTRS